ncbi:hypothetical protein LMJF_35_4200 [Leishmania major strain Friedlin]|uniref:Uncharacterized protein n=1 Tax=Leishmania major TaxID=5664 RepID=E9AFP7_LEIMA|nr:hypothetical protein LMJF_35_4200 [Leishmania major strain Friedlin]CAG9582778.1 hypothetical_protein_-_conserved [Leishmania major strain Friedlin]CBZ13051.1 hypothetical protein LMJF_35_4200 [Leishmania major strain Friedlin]|eukprot:XP_003722817.1 hypothetical protein LMJF_35_4200 [Leishmania major strain Friedlin]
MQMRRDALGNGKALEFAKELSLAYKQVIQATQHIGKQRQALTGCTDLSVKTREWAAAEHDIAGALEKYGAAPYWVEQRGWRPGRLQSFEAAHSRASSGTEVSYLCSRLRGYVKAAFTAHVTKPPKLNASEVDVAELLTFFTGSGDGALVVEVALAKFFVVENMHVRAPELWVMNYLLHCYGVEEGIMLAHEADVVDGGFKQQGGGAFEEQFLIQKNIWAVSQVLVPHCYAVTRCDEATAKAGVEACVRCEGTEGQGTEGAFPTWPGTPPASLPPAYRLARSVNDYGKEAGEDKTSRIIGELDGVIYDASARQVLLVLEAKQNIDVCKAFKQKERLYNALDATRKTLSQASQGAALTAVQLSAENETNTATTTAAGRNATPAAEAACAASTKLHTDPVVLRFFVTPTPAAEAARENFSVNGCSLVTGVGAEPAANFQDMRNSGDMASAAAPPVRSKAAAARLATAGNPFFTQDNFAAFFGATASAVQGDSTAPSPTPTRSDSMTPRHLGRDQRWIYLTSLSTGNSPGARTTVPAPGGTIHMVELTLVKTACNFVAEAYDSYFQISTLPPTATPALQSLVSAMRVCSAYAPETEPMALFHLFLELPPQECISARAETAAVSRSDPCEYVLHLFRHDVRCKDGAAALEQVWLRENFIDGLVLSEHSFI